MAELYQLNYHGVDLPNLTGHGYIAVGGGKILGGSPIAGGKFEGTYSIVQNMIVAHGFVTVTSESLLVTGETLLPNQKAPFSFGIPVNPSANGPLILSNPFRVQLGAEFVAVQMTYLGSVP